MTYEDRVRGVLRYYRETAVKSPTSSPGNTSMNHKFRVGDLVQPVVTYRAHYGKYFRKVLAIEDNGNYRLEDQDAPGGFRFWSPHLIELVESAEPLENEWGEVCP